MKSKVIAAYGRVISNVSLNGNSGIKGSYRAASFIKKKVERSRGKRRRLDAFERERERGKVLKWLFNNDAISGAERRIQVRKSNVGRVRRRASNAPVRDTNVFRHYPDAT